MAYEEILQRSKELLQQSHRQMDSLKILAVSKLQPTNKIEALYQKHHRYFAENYVQEALEKQKSLRHLEIEWHFIGTLQKNKVKSVLGNFELIHSVDSLKLAEAISFQASKLQVNQKILLQVNIAGEASKGGFTEQELVAAWPHLQTLPGLRIEGLMTMPPLTEDPEVVRPYFKALKQLQFDLLKQKTSSHSLKELSMGTSHDYHVAIQEGATIVRLGTVLFGERVQHRTQQ